MPAVLALVFAFLSWSHTLDPCSGVGTGPDGEVLGCRSTLDAPWMWVGWVACMLVAYFMMRRNVAVTLQHHLAPAREATMRALTRTLPLVIVAAALVGGVIVGLLGPYVFGYFAILGFPLGLVGMLGAAAGGVALVRHRTCPTVETPAE
ncbi:hypothetical protein [Streptomyces sirii]|uniref:hypothetical protein n=1 Tax=Streptomyces sirii TaxID=3127701 RepID=UPI003D369075